MFIKLIKIKRNKSFCIILFLYYKTLHKLTKLFSSDLSLLIWIVQNLLICFEFVKLKILHSEEKNITLSTRKISHQLSLLLPLRSNHFSVSLNAHKSQLFRWTITEKKLTLNSYIFQAHWLILHVINTAYNTWLSQSIMYGKFNIIWEKEFIKFTLDIYDVRNFDFSIYTCLTKNTLKN